MAQTAGITNSLPGADRSGGRDPDDQTRTGSAAAWRLKVLRPLRTMAVMLCAVLVVNMIAQIRLNEWQGAFFDAIGERNRVAFTHQLTVFAAIAAILLVAVVSQTWLQEQLKVRLRSAITSDLIDRWLDAGRAHRLKTAGAIGENPDQRIHEDVRHLCDLTPELVAGLVQSTLLLISFVGILWTLSSSTVVPFGDGSIVVPGYLLWWALGYACLGSWLTWLLGRPLIRLNDRRYSEEAELRALLVNLGRNATAVALAGGERREREAATRSLARVLATSFGIARAIVRLTWVTSAYGWGTLVVPVIAASPAYFGGSMSLGDLMMAVGAFSQVQQALRWFVDNFARIADWRATFRRVDGLREAMSDRAGDGLRSGRIRTTSSRDGTLRLSNVTVEIPGSKVTLGEPQVMIAPGDRVLFSGDGSGHRSGVFHFMAGLQDARSGEAVLPERADIVMLTPHPYLPAGPLKEAICYPDQAALHGDAKVREILGHVGLGSLASDLDRRGDWEHDLPHGHQQLLAVARVLLRRPRWVLLDDALNALDAKQRIACLALLDRDLSESAVITGGRIGATDLAWTLVVHVKKRARPRAKRQTRSPVGPIARNVAETKAPEDGS